MTLFSKQCIQTVEKAGIIAQNLHHDLVTPDHLILALIEDQDACKVMRGCGICQDTFKQGLSEFFDQHWKIPVNDKKPDILHNEAFSRVIRNAEKNAKNSGRSHMTGANLLVALFDERESVAVRLFQQHGVTRVQVINFIAHGVAIDSTYNNSPFAYKNAEWPDGQKPSSIDSDDSESGDSKPALEKYCDNLNDKARTGSITPLIGRTNLVMRCIEVLRRHSKNNPLLVGDPGVGKTAIVEGLAHMIVNGNAPEILSNTTIYALNIGTLVAGTKWRGDFEKRFNPILAEMNAHPDAILFIDEIHMIQGAGAAHRSNIDVGNLLKPALQDGKLRVIGATTYKEFFQKFSKDPALVRRFRKIDVNEPSSKESLEILRGLKHVFEKHHEVRYTAAALKAAVQLSVRHIHDRKLPDKSIEIIDEAGATHFLVPEYKRHKTIGVKDIEAVVARIARIPAKNINRNDAKILEHLETSLNQVVFGQKEAVTALSNAIRLSRAGLREPEQPVGNYLFSGPTGVGKTEVARQLAEILGIELLRFDMSEYMTKCSVSRLIGADPGYVGFDQGGQLTNAIDKHPHCVLLFDEIEKAHPDICNILLQVMDHGKLTDNTGRAPSFRNAILIMTSNAGAREQGMPPVGFTRDYREGEDIAAIERIFTPEFRNRLDAMISFAPLSKEIIFQVVGKLVSRLETLCSERNVSIELTPDATEWLANKGYDDKMGARPLARVIQEHIKQPLARELLYGDLTKGGIVRVSVGKQGLELKISGLCKA